MVLRTVKKQSSLYSLHGLHSLKGGASQSVRLVGENESPGHFAPSVHYYSVVLLPFVGCLYGLESAVACPVRAGAASARRTRAAAAQAARGVTKRTSSKSQERLQRLPLLLCGAAVALLEAAVAVCEYVLWRLLHSGEADVQGGRETLIVVDVNTLCPECMYTTVILLHSIHTYAVLQL